jgi:regulator of sigma E protease
MPHLFGSLTGADVWTAMLAILALGVLIVVHEGGHYLVARWSGMRVDRFSIGLGPKIWGFKHGETEFQVSAIPFGGFVQIAGLNPGEEGLDLNDPRAYPNRPPYQRLLTIFAGPLTNYVFAAFIIACSYLAWGVPEAGKQPLVGGVVQGAPAANAGLQPGDELRAVDGHPVAAVSEVPPLIAATHGREFSIEVLRDGKPVTLSLKAVAANGTDFRVGIELAEKEVRVPASVGVALGRAAIFPYEYTRFIIHGFAEIFAGRQPLQLGGPPAILKAMKNQIAHGLRSAVDIIAIISVYLGFFNLVPLPALDGGRMVFIVYEMIFRKPFNQRIEQAIHGYAMLGLLALILIISTKDIIGFFHR